MGGEESYLPFRLFVLSEISQGHFYRVAPIPESFRLHFSVYPLDEVLLDCDVHFGFHAFHCSLHLLNLFYITRRGRTQTEARAG